MKLSQLKSTKDAVAFTILNPVDGEPLVNEEGAEVKLYMLGKASDAYQNLQDKYLRKAAERMKSNKKTAADELTVEKIKKDSIETIVACSVKIVGLEDEEGKPITTKEQFETIYADPANDWLTTQAKQFLEDDKNFIKSASKN